MSLKRRNVRKIAKKDRAGNPTGGHAYRARYEGPDGRERTRHFETKKEAESWLDEQSARIVTGTYVDPNAGRITFEEYAEDWRLRQVHRPSTAGDYGSQLMNHAYPALGKTRLTDLQPSQIQAWVKHLSTSLAPSTVRKIHGIVAGILNDAVRDRRLAHNPCEGTRLPEIPERKVMIPTPEQVVAIHRHMPAAYKPLVHLGVAAGLRQGEAFGLTADRVNFLRREITIDRQMVQAKGGPRFGPPKTKKSNRAIPIPQQLVDDLARHIDEFGLGRDGLIFTAGDRGPVRKSTFNSRLNTARELAECKAMTFHWLRHYYASLLIRYGESVKTVQARLGHATAAETLDTYGHLWPDSDDRTREAAATALWVPSQMNELGDNEGTTGA